MTRSRLALASTLAILAVTVAAPSPRAAAASDDMSMKADSSKVERGRYLVTVWGCNDCHTPWKMGDEGPAPDMTRMLSGHPQGLAITAIPAVPEGPWMAVVSNTFTGWAGPWGVSFSRNLTPDNATGLGTWTEEEFIATLRHGRQRGIGRELLPPMPWQNYGQGTDEDLSAVFAFLQSIPAISNQVPDPIPPPAQP